MRRVFAGSRAGCVAALASLALAAWPSLPAWAATPGKRIPAAEAGKYVGEEATVCGTVVGGVYADRSNGQPTFLDFDKAYPEELFRVIIWRADRAKFKEPPEQLFHDKHVCATGKIQLYHGKPEIVVRDPAQLILDQVRQSAAWWPAAGIALILLALVGAAVRLRHGFPLQRGRQLTRIDDSLVDPLTGARNRRFFDQVVPAECRRVLRHYRNLASGAQPPDRNHDLLFCVVDLDRFKTVNDLYGHRAGDEVLRVVAQRLGSALRDIDLLFRWGGDEFLVVFRDSERGQGDELANRLMEAVRSAPISLGARSAMKVTCSVGWAPYPWFSDAPAELSAEEVLDLADRGLYAAKAGGRDRAAGLLPTGNCTPETLQEIREGDRSGGEESSGWWRLLRYSPENPPNHPQRGSESEGPALGNA
ncbi:MAG TPA: GGDEF domain-containing protein [Thermoanaerobaculia bacterium]|nr:GGDEF domain-containing protein [Thermoanaerobaculia bacterium]